MRANHTKIKGKKNVMLVIAGVLLSLILILAALLALGLYHTQDLPSDEPYGSTGSASSVEQPAQIVETEDLELALGQGLTLVEVGKYVGVYMEDGTNELVSDVLMVIVRNDGANDIQYAEIILETSSGNAQFNLTTLPVGESAVLLEQSRMLWSEQEAYSTATAQNIALFTMPLGLCEDQLKLQVLDGVINITNISGEDITGDIVLYYKNASSDLLYGGITYRVRLEGGLKANEIRQITANHYTQSGSRIMFVTVE